MPTSITTAQDIQTLWSALRRSVHGASLAELLERQPQLARRSVQRWLRMWVDAGRLEAVGAGPARRYHVTAAGRSIRGTAVVAAATGATAGKSAASAPAGALLEGLVPVAADSLDILAYIDQPLIARKPVGWQLELLEAYQPNRTHHLGEALRRQLRRMGSTNGHELPAGTHGRAILNRLLIDLSWASSHLEGNTYSRLDTRELIEFGRAAQGKAAAETQMILNHKAAIELLVDNAASAGFNRHTLFNLHAVLAENLLPNPADEGRVRRHAVEIAHSVYRPLAVPQQIDAGLDLLLAKAAAIADPFEQAFFTMVWLPYLQPFADVNKRCSRLLANLPLFKANLCPLTFLGVPQEVYHRAVLGVYEMGRFELLRDLFAWAYERSTQEYLSIRHELAQPDPARLAWRSDIRRIVHAVVTNPGRDALSMTRELVHKAVPAAAREALRELVVQELQRLHEGVLARYALRPSQLVEWRLAQTALHQRVAAR